jgi:hypothetical protein
MVKPDGTLLTVYVDESYAVVSVQDGPAGGHGDGHGRGHDGAPDDDSTGTSSSTDSGSTTTY